MIFNIDLKKSSLFLLLLIIFCPAVFCQKGNDRHRTYINLDYVKIGDQPLLRAALTARVQGVRGRKKIENAEIHFYQLRDTSHVFLGSAATDVNGDASFKLIRQGVLPTGVEGAYEFEAVFNGDDEFRDAAKDLSIQPAILEITFSEVDSIKYIILNAFRLSSDGSQVPVNEDVSVYVPRQFSRLKIGEIELDEGAGEVEFPVALPGDAAGNLTIVARIEESRAYGTLEVQAVKDWGAVREPVVVENRRGLGDTDAPLWMVYTLIVLMSAVWFHYVYLFYVMFLIKRKGVTRLKGVT